MINMHLMTISYRLNSHVYQYDGTERTDIWDEQVYLPHRVGCDGDRGCCIVTIGIANYEKGDVSIDDGNMSTAVTQLSMSTG